MKRHQAIATAVVGAVVLAGIVAGLVRERASRVERLLPVRPVPGKPGRYATGLRVMGTDARLDVLAPGEAAARRMLRPAVAELRAVEALMSSYRPDSDVGRLNRQGAEGEVPLSGPTLAVLREAVRAWELTGGAFDVTCAPLRALWWEAQRTGRLPEPDALERALALVGCDRLLVGPGGARFAREGMEVDLGGIAKGHAIDRAVEALQDAGARAGIVDVGGDLRLFGEPAPGAPWRVQVQSPPEMRGRIVLSLSARAVATSGDYARTFTVEGREFSHIIDPRTGRPVADVPSVTVVAGEAAAADALATGVSVMGAADGLALIESLPAAECLVMTRGPDGGLLERMSSGFAQFLEEQ
jgi:thiamine biosynthesis lipoprotein